ncbi:histidinol-phosphatase HisJ [Companilactobacillus nodensis]|uniref:Histidinol-phosphatase n=1 Tax=Companilactobacillus nodensis DSM 19682 = JCM 14932 = NBRC 107160 TaxID=1423775 RepID=A0A0R1K6J1_9LACO|nr:histidinol-phosphatase HisJ [Companilactobacillus nodensis]KRK79263.1 histidinol-phosphatase [Companilactobacillus nodensis DSM 19682 = JCM 14932 = NBRC 107160]
MLLDGHTHTEFCQHGSGEPAEKMILRAIQLGMKKYCITEHAPLPADFKSVYDGDPDGFDTGAMDLTDLPDYMKQMQRLQKKYQSELEISIGFEVDYLEGFEDWTRDFLDEYGPQTQESILSVHFMQGKGQKQWCIDYDTDAYQEGFVQFLDDPQHVFKQYYETVKKSVEADLGQYRPQRIGHMSLVRKFQDYFGLAEDYDAENMKLITGILQEIKQQSRELDLNLAGLYKPLCNDFYPGRQITEVAKELGIPLIYGSDAHDIASVGHGQHLVESANLA